MHITGHLILHIMRRINDPTSRADYFCSAGSITSLLLLKKSQADKKQGANISSLCSRSQLDIYAVLLHVMLLTMGYLLQASFTSR